MTADANISESNSRESPRIAILVPDLRLGGFERLVTVLAKEWVALGCRVDIVMLKREGALIEALPESCRVIDLAARQFRHSVFPLADYFRKNKPQSTLLGMWPLTAIGTLAWLLAGRPGNLVVGEHCPLESVPAHALIQKKWFLRLSITVFYRLATRRIGVSNGVADSMAKVGWLSRDSIDVIYNPAAYRFSDCFQANSSPALTSLPGISVKQKNLLAVGTLKKDKDYPTLLAAIALLPCDLGVSLTILGDGPLRTELAGLVESAGLGERVTLMGSVLDPTPWFQSADLFVLASRYEGFGNVIVEALQWGVPVVSTDCPSGPAEILDGGRYGKLVPVGDANALAEAICESLSQTPDRQLLEQRARDFSPRPIALQYLSVLLDGPQKREDT